MLVLNANLMMCYCVCPQIGGRGRGVRRDEAAVHGFASGESKLTCTCTRQNIHAGFFVVFIVFIVVIVAIFVIVFIVFCISAHIFLLIVVLLCPPAGPSPVVGVTEQVRELYHQSHPGMRMDGQPRTGSC